MVVQSEFLCIILLSGCVSPAPIKTVELQMKIGTEGCPQVNFLVVTEGATQSVTLIIDETKVSKVSKYNPQTGQWNELLMAVHGSSNSLTKTSVSLVNQNIMVQNATKANEGLYMVTSYLYETCLAQINVTVVLDSTSPVSTTASSVTPKTPSPASSSETVPATAWSITGNFGMGAVFVSATIVIIRVVQKYC